MKPQFTTRCFVRVKDAEKRKEILEKTSDFLLPINMSTDSNYLFAFDGWVSRIYGRGLRGEQGIKELEAANFIDCGTNTELFLALAGMRSDTDKGQWFNTIGSEYRKESWILCQSHQIYDDSLSGECRKATAQEIIEHFSKETK